MENVQTLIIDEVLFSHTRELVELYYKVCLRAGITPKYTGFVVHMGLDKWTATLNGVTVKLSDSRINRAYLDKRLYQKYSAWRKSCIGFTGEEWKIIQSHNLRPNFNLLIFGAMDTRRKL